MEWDKVIGENLRARERIGGLGISFFSFSKGFFLGVCI